MPDLQILPECYADTALVMQFVQNRQLVVHIFGIPNVAKEMQEEAGREHSGMRIGFVDNDKRVPPYLQSFATVLEENKIVIKRKGQTQQYLIVVDKAIESFLLWNARQIGLHVSDYGFSSDIKTFGKALKTSSIGSNNNYLQLLADLHARQAPGFLTLERILNDFITT
ncbi:hypothetical protein BN8_04447 [Fibrisoma limi BUZ 3]|uniref:Uncharacterized protein n=1 Tax=Fibrisoma limi BUZ 3 TaxID=1185876 RepID=I2GMS8_9BACT|nr:hypothetical protein [Fibrisoma limi]CCH55206.1 hypothetical protein BN8_04447 [Fibrisoma limi BUZ 3]